MIQVKFSCIVSLSSSHWNCKNNNVSSLKNSLVIPSTRAYIILVYINDLEEGVTGKILKFADDTKLFRKTKEIGDKQKLQDDIDKLVKWSEKWQMLFNLGKCRCLHTGPGNTGMNYEMGGTILSKTLNFVSGTGNELVYSLVNTELKRIFNSSAIKTPCVINL